METEDRYCKPEVKVIVVELENVIACSFSDDLDNGREVNGASNAKRRGLWGDE